jgi:hypothetical protein
MTTNTNELIKHIAVDIICITTIWSLVNNPNFTVNYYIRLNNNLYNISPMYNIIAGFGITFYVLTKYI